MKIKNLLLVVTGIVSFILFFPINIFANSEETTYEEDEIQLYTIDEKHPSNFNQSVDNLIIPLEDIQENDIILTESEENNEIDNFESEQNNEPITSDTLEQDNELNELDEEVEKEEPTQVNQNMETSDEEVQVKTKEVDEQKVTTLQSLDDNYLFKSGDNSPEVKELKLKLARIGFVVSSNPNNSYGPKTVEVVEKFQEYYGLDVIGAVDQKTLEKIEEILSSPFQNGKSHDDVIQLKKDLEQLGFKVSNNPNRNYGPSTEKKVKEFQEFYGLVVNGIVDEVTREKMDELLNSPLKRGDYRKDVINLKLDLAQLGFVISNNPNPSFGPSTEKIVKEFQRYYNLKQTGIVDTDTKAKIESLLENSLKKGKKSNEVLKLKQDLAKLGFVVSSNPNNSYGPTTEKVVKEFQKYYSLRVSGIAEERTLEKIREILSNPFQNGKSHDDVIQLKKDLEQLGFKVSNNPNRNYGPSTEKKVKEFQEFYGLVVNGIVDEVTRAKMDELLNSPLKRGDYRKDVINLKLDLAQLGFVISNNPNPLFGPSTEKIVKEFQRYYNLKQTGIVDTDTKAKIESLLENSLKKGKKSNEVLKLKQDLAKLGFVVSSNPNNSYGPTTEKVVKEFQKYYSLRVSGIAEERTLEKIREILSSPFQNGKSHDDVIQLKKDLEQLGFKVSNNPNRNYGPTTTRKVKEFQTYYNLVINGIADEVTLNKIKSVLSSPLQRGNEHKDVIKLKKDLQTLGYGSFAGNERFGPATEKAVKKFQQDHNLAVSGIAEEVTLAMISKLIAELNKITIVIDPGHGGDDPGAVGNGLREKDINLDIAKRVKKLLEKAGYQVVMTRNNDKDLTLAERSQMANKLNADLFVSIHTNSGGGQGIETWWYGKYEGEKSRELATQIQTEVIKETGTRDRGVKGSMNGKTKAEGNFHVNRETKMPSALIEVGFIDNKNDAAKLKSTKYKDQVAKGIVNGIISYFKIYS